MTQQEKMKEAEVKAGPVSVRGPVGWVTKVIGIFIVLISLGGAFWLGQKIRGTSMMNPTYTPYPTLTPRPTYTPYPSPTATQNIAEPKGEKTVTPTPVLYRVRKNTFVYEGPGPQNDTIGRLKENERVLPITGPIKTDGVEWWLVDSSEMQGWVPGDTIEPLALQSSQGLEACIKSNTGEVYVWSDAQIEQGGNQISDTSLRDRERVVVLNPQPRKAEINSNTGSFLKVRSEERPEIEGWVLREGVIYLRQGEECP